MLSYLYLKMKVKSQYPKTTSVWAKLYAIVLIEIPIKCSCAKKFYVLGLRHFTSQKCS